MFALMGDRLLRPCSLSFSYFEFEDERRSSPAFPFSIAMSEWRPWVAVRDHKSPVFWIVAGRPDFSEVYYDYLDLLAISGGRLWHRRLMPCLEREVGWLPVTQGGGAVGDEPELGGQFFAAAASAQPGSLFLAVQSGGALFANEPSPSGCGVGGGGSSFCRGSLHRARSRRLRRGRFRVRWCSLCSGRIGIFMR
jgi:hypothetical protein